MNRRDVLGLSTVVAFGLASMGGDAVGQQKSLKDELIGAWLHISTKYKFPDGKTEDAFGPGARGILILDASGRVAFVNMRASLPKFASNDRMNGTAEEYKAIGQGSYAFFGTYTVNEADRSFTIHVEGSTFPNYDGANQKRSSITLVGDELRYSNPVATIGPGVVVEGVWKRAK